MTESLYERLGGTEGCNQLASDLADIHLANSTFFIAGTGDPTSTKARVCWTRTGE
jgi:hypothetical protein